MLYFAFFSLLFSSNPKIPGDISNPWYMFEAHDKQSQPIVHRISKIFSPTMGNPALLGINDKMVLWSKGKPEVVSIIPSDGCGEPIYLKIAKSSYRAGNNGLAGLYRTLLIFPPDVQRATYNLSVKWKSDQTTSIELQCVRYTGKDFNKDFSILFYADHQLRDPSWKLFNGLKSSSEFPKKSDEKLNSSVTREEFREIKLLDPDMVIHLGDLLFGLDYTQEYAEAYDTWKKSGFSTWFIPGNHDAYATYTLKMPNIASLGLGLIKCRNKLPSNWKNWRSVFGFVVCLYGDVKNTLFNNLVSDGLVSWKNILGPDHYSFSKGKFHFIFLNTYGGTNKRRHSFSVYFKFRGYYLGAPGVDNYGGYLSPKDITDIKRELAYASKHGLTPVILAHQDPRGNLDQQAYHENEPFPTHPIGADHFEEWNFDGKWDSNPLDSRKKETQNHNSAISLLRLLAQSGGYYISGHIHKDGQWVFNKGEEIAHGIKAKKKITFIKVTTAASAKKDNGYWGYRYIIAKSDGTLDVSPYGKNLLSIPAGNFWVDRNIDLDTGKIKVTSSLSIVKQIYIDMCLPSEKEGFQISGDKRGKVVLKSAPLINDGKKRRYRYSYFPPIDSSPFETPVSKVLQLKPAKGNKAPVIKLTMNGKIVNPDNVIFPGVLDASLSTDPEKSVLFEPSWKIGNKVIKGFQLKLERKLGKIVEATFRVRDENGSWSFQNVKCKVAPLRKKRAAFGCGCTCVFAGTTGAGTLMGIFIFIFIVMRRRKKLVNKIK